MRAFYRLLRRTPLLLIATGSSLILLTACDNAEDPKATARPGDTTAPGAAVEAKVTRLGTEASDALMKSLGAQLKAALQSGGPTEAVAVCQQAALPITESTSGAFDHVTVSRTSLRHRNPANAPDDIDKAVLTAMENALKADSGTPDPVIRWQDEAARFYRPLMVQEVCLNCHGDATSFPEDLSTRLATLYPDDRATGYAVGDLRGVIRVDVDWRKLP